MLSNHPFLPHVTSEKDEDGVVYWRLGARRVLWSKALRWREDALAYFLSEMSGHEILALRRELTARGAAC